jgi:hypothetical protein
MRHDHHVVAPQIGMLEPIEYRVGALRFDRRRIFLAATDRTAYMSRGRLAQLVERFVYTEDVGSSSLSSPTIITH